MSQPVSSPSEREIVRFIKGLEERGSDSDSHLRSPDSVLNRCLDYCRNNRSRVVQMNDTLQLFQNTIL